MGRVLEWLVALLAIGCSSVAFAAPIHHNNVLLLIQPAEAGPYVDPLSYWQPQWILWPPARDPSSGGRLLSILSGRDWVGRASDFLFVPASLDIGWKAGNFPAISESGYFSERVRTLGSVRTQLLVSGSASASPDALRLALNPDGAPVLPCRVTDAQWPSGALMVGQVNSWDEVAQIEHCVDGRILIVEYPPRVEAPWTRYWLRGEGWKKVGLVQAVADHAISPTERDLGVIGLIRARSLGRLIVDPAPFERSPVSPSSFAGANRYLSVETKAGPYASIVALAVFGLILIWGVGRVALERSSEIAPKLLMGVLLSPSILVLAGELARFGGPDAWMVWLGVSAIIMVVLLAAATALQRRWASKAHSSLAVSVVTIAVLASIDPEWSFLSPVFSGSESIISYTAFGALFCSLVLAVSSVHGLGAGWIWSGRILCVAFVGAGSSLGLWWGRDVSALTFCAFAAFMIGEQRITARWMMLLMLWPTSVYRSLTKGIVYLPSGLIQTNRTIGAANSALFVEFLMSPAAWITVMVVVWFCILGPKFVLHQFKRIVDTDRRRNALTYATGAGAFFSVLAPEFLPATLVAATAAVSGLLSDAIQSM